jgi:apolipoprotein N-acyltransferase
MLGWLRRLGAALKHLLTAKDGETYAPARVYWCLGSVQFLALAAWSTIAQQNAFNATDYATGFSAILVAGGVGVWITRKTEPDD